MHNSYSKSFLFTIPLILSLTFTLFAQEQIIFDYLTLDDGLSQSTVSSILQDETGFMWFGTLDGLNKFDGYNFTIYNNKDSDPATISDDWINTLYIDKKGSLWIGTLNGGLNRYNKITDDFTRYPLDFFYNYSPVQIRKIPRFPYFKNFLNNSSITAIYQDADSTFWVGTFGNGLFIFYQHEEIFSHRPFDFFDANGLSHNIMVITETVDSSGSILWIGTFGGGLLKFEKNKGFTRYLHDHNDSNSLSNNQIMSIIPTTISEKKYLWIATYGGGLNKFDIENETFQHYKTKKNDVNFINDDYLNTLYLDDHNVLWIGTLKGGMNKFNINTNSWSHYKHSALNKYCVNSDEVISIYEDKSETIWIGTRLGNGLNKFNKGTNKFIHYNSDKSNKNSLSDKAVFSILKDKAGILWVGTYKGGLNRIDRKKNEFKHFLHDPQDDKTISDNHIRVIFEDSKGLLWLGTVNGGLDCLNRDTGIFKHYRHDAFDAKSIGSNYIKNVIEDQDNNLWIGTFGGGLNKYERKGDYFVRYKNDPNDPNSISDNRMFSICEDEEDFIWIATFEGGFDKFDKKSEKFTHHKHDPYDSNSLCYDRLLTLVSDPFRKNTLWIGTFGGGLDRYNYKTKTFTHYTEKDGLPNNVIYGILHDDDGYLWLSTNKGISKFDPEINSFINYDISDGLQSNEYNGGAYYKCPLTGEMFFGGINGFNSFYPKDVQLNLFISPIVITSFKIFGKETSNRFGPISQVKELNLSYKDKFISFEFSALNYTDLRNNQFIYKLDGLNDEWIRCGTQNSATFTNLDPGKYTFRVKGCNSDGIWNEIGASIDIIIHPPFWDTHWFYALVICIIFSSIILFYRYRLKINIKRSLELERIRIAENELVRRTVAADFHDELGQKLTRISLFSEILKRQLGDDLREHFTYIDKINNAAKELSLSTRDFIWTINPIQDSLHDVAIYLKDFGDDVFDKTGVNFRVKGINKNLETIKLPMRWRRHITLIFKEAMNNALKHAECRNILFILNLDDRVFEITLSDDGIGYDTNMNSPGLGLFNIKNRAKLINSELKIYSSEKNGTTIKLVSEIPQKGY